MVNSFSMSLVVRRPRSMTRAPTSRTNVTARPVNGSHRHVGIRLDDRPHQLDALLVVEERLLVRVDADADDEPVEDPAAATDDVEVAEVDGVEGAGVDGEAMAERRGHVEAPSSATRRSSSSTVL